MHRKVFLEREQ
ncbi:unnamed protein product, partial [Allacma fusca]